MPRGQVDAGGVDRLRVIPVFVSVPFEESDSTGQRVGSDPQPLARNSGLSQPIALESFENSCLRLYVRRLGPCEILERVGAGGMGEVYRARDTAPGGNVAIKVCAPSDSVNDPNDRHIERHWTVTS